MPSTGKIKQIIGAVVDVSFPGEDTKLPEIFNALEITRDSGESLILEWEKKLKGDCLT